MRGRLRLTLPDDALDPWLVALELVDDADPGKWCTADDVWERAPRALDVAGEPRRLAALEQEVLSVAAVVAPSVTGMAELAADHEPSVVELDLEQADDFIDCAPAELARLGIELLGPEQLVTVKPAVRGTAREAPADDRKGHFSKEALVDWEAVVDGTPLSEADLARIEAAGTSLLRTGHRWVRIDPAGLRRARAPARGAPRATRPGRAGRAAAPVGRQQTADGDVAIELGIDDDDGDDADDDDRRPPAGWRRCSPGCPTNAWRRSSSRRGSTASCGTTSAAGWRGCSSSHGSGSAAASPTTWGSARPPRRSPICSNGPARTSWSAR